MEINNGQPVAAATFNKAIKQYRKLSGISARELATRVDRSTSYIAHIENGIRNVSITDIEIIVDALQLSEEQSKQLVYEGYKSIKQIPFYSSASQADDYKLITLVADWSKLTQEQRNNICQTITQVVSC